MSATTINKSILNKAELWHLKMGHLPFRLLPSVFPDLDKHHGYDDFLCTICPMVKQTRCMFPKSSIKTTNCF